MERMIGTYTVDDQTIEYSITGEKGEPILVMHGGHSNCYESFGYDALVESGFMVITPSRAGYGQTSKKMGDHLSRACDYYMKLLNYLEIESVHVLAMSAGGPSGLYLAAHYPDRVKTLTLQSAVTKEWHTPKDKIYKLAQILFHPYMEKMTWKLTANMSKFFPEFMFKQMVSSFSTLPYQQVKGKIMAEDIEAFRKMTCRQRSGYGFLIDLLQTKEITPTDLHAISPQTLIMHSQHDSAVSLEHAHYAHQHIPNANLCMLTSWGHLIWLGEGSEETEANLIDFLTRHS